MVLCKPHIYCFNSVWEKGSKGFRVLEQPHNVELFTVVEQQPVDPITNTSPQSQSHLAVIEAVPGKVKNQTEYTMKVVPMQFPIEERSVSLPRDRKEGLALTEKPRKLIHRSNLGHSASMLSSMDTLSSFRADSFVHVDNSLSFLVMHEAGARVVFWSDRHQDYFPFSKGFLNVNVIEYEPDQFLFYSD